MDTLESVASREPRVASFFQYIVAQYGNTPARQPEPQTPPGGNSRFSATVWEQICLDKIAIMDVYP
jgi:hypothetical protein